jgi:amino acid transporter
LVILLYLAVNLTYVSIKRILKVVFYILTNVFDLNFLQMMIIPKHGQLTDGQIQRFLEHMFNKISLSGISGPTLLNASIALSSFGNVVVMTYTVARVVQEIAKDGLLPSWVFHTGTLNPEATLRRTILDRLNALTPRRFKMSPSMSGTPTGALFFHMMVSILTVLVVTATMAPSNTYDLLSQLEAYTRYLFGAIILAGIFCFDYSWIRPGLKFLIKWPPIRVFSSMLAFIFLIGPIIFLLHVPFKSANFLPGNSQNIQSPMVTGLFSYWEYFPSILLGLFVVGITLYIGFWGHNAYREKQLNKVWVVEKIPKFRMESCDASCSGCQGDNCNRGDGLVLLSETVHLSWVGRESLERSSSQF